MSKFRTVILLAFLLLPWGVQVHSQGLLRSIGNLVGTTLRASDTLQASHGDSLTGKSPSAVSRISGFLEDMMGLSTLRDADITGTWRISGPSYALTTDNKLARTGGTVARTQVLREMASLYGAMGADGSNLSFSFNEDGTFQATVLGNSVTGTCELNLDNGQIWLESDGFVATGYMGRTSEGLRLLFETRKLLELFHTIGGVPEDDASLNDLVTLSQSFGGMRMGFALVR